MEPEKIKEIFIANMAYLKDNVNRLSYRDKKYYYSINKQLQTKAVDDLSPSQVSIINEIARRAKQNRHSTKETRPQEKHIIRLRQRWHNSSKQ